ncbi:MAG: DNA-binding response regulator, partial [Peptostreptococcaceae bacterium]
QRHMSTIISKSEYKRRNNEKEKKRYKDKLKMQGKISKQEEITKRRLKIKDLLNKGLKQKDILMQLNISKDTYIRDRKYLKEESLI